jgi:hypothetical protein
VWSYQLAEARQHPNAAVMVLNPQIDDQRLLDFGRVDLNYLQSRQTFREALEDDQLLAAFGRE